ncbi:hypothetical protein COV61_05490, partial [Candidatus Micrarchaeota archaeon CG11_big_fil_rev_8_21_14_0_20_47_5]
PEIIQPGQTITATLLIGNRPAIGEKISVQTPIGNVTRTTNIKGQVNLVALDEGNYRFTYKELSYRVVSTSNSNPEPTTPSETGQPTPAQPQEGAGAQITEETNDPTMIYLLAGGALIAFILLALLLLAIAKATKAGKAHKGKEEAKGIHAHEAKKKKEAKGTHAQEAKKGNGNEGAKGIHVQHAAAHEAMETAEKEQEKPHKKEKHKPAHAKGKKKGKATLPQEGEVPLENYFSQ